MTCFRLVFVIKSSKIYLCSMDGGKPTIFQKDGSAGYEISNGIDDDFVKWVETKTGIVANDEVHICCVVAKECTYLRKQLCQKFQKQSWHVIYQGKESWKAKNLCVVINQILDINVNEKYFDSRHGGLPQGWSVSNLYGEKLKLDLQEAAKKDDGKKKNNNKRCNVEYVAANNQAPTSEGKEKRIKVYTSRQVEKTKNIVVSKAVEAEICKNNTGKISEQKPELTCDEYNAYLREKNRNYVRTVPGE